MFVIAQFGPVILLLLILFFVIVKRFFMDPLSVDPQHWYDVIMNKTKVINNFATVPSP